MSAARNVPAAGSDQELAGLLARHVKGLAIDVNKVRAHIVSPQNIQGVFSDKGPTEAPNFLPRGGVGIRPEFLDVPAFGAALQNALRASVGGYSAQLRQHGKPIFSSNWQSAKRPQDGNEDWTQDVPLHVASVCKLITAMAMTLLMAEKGISPDTPIIDFLPDYWAKGANIQYIVFRNLFNHTSGIFRSDDHFDFSTMKSVIAAGISLSTDPNTTHLGRYQYHNLNYGLCRVLLAVMNGNISKSATFNLPLFDFNDFVWDTVAVDSYANFVQSRIFQPSGVSGATLDHPGDCGLAYKEPGDTEHGWNSGNLETISGADGWHVSVNQLLDVMGEFRRGGGIVPPEAAQAMLANGFGVDPLVTIPTYPLPFPWGLLTPAGEMYCKPGTWFDGIGREEQALAYFLPQDMELVVLANSEVAGTDPHKLVLLGMVTQIYLDNLSPQLVNA